MYHNYDAANCKKIYDELLYNEDLLNYIQKNILLLEIVDSHFKIHGKEYTESGKDASVKVYPNNKFFYDCCFAHDNTPIYSFFVDMNMNLYYCFGCGCGGSVFEFVMGAYNLDINEATELLGSFLNIFTPNLLDQKLKIIYDELIENYGKQDELFQESKRKTDYLSARVENYLNNMDLSDIDIKKIADRLCCSTKFVKKKYEETDYYKEKVLIKKRENEKTKSKMIFE